MGIIFFTHDLYIFAGVTQPISAPIDCVFSSYNLKYGSDPISKFKWKWREVTGTTYKLFVSITCYVISIHFQISLTNVVILLCVLC